MAFCHEQCSKLIDTSFVHLLAIGRAYRSFDPRDTVYGFLVLANEHTASNITANYNLPVPEVFKNVAVQLIISSQSLALLVSHSIRIKMVREYPTWVPDWRPLDEPERMEWNHRLDRLTQYGSFSACSGMFVRAHDLQEPTV